MCVFGRVEASQGNLHVSTEWEAEAVHFVLHLNTLMCD